MSVDIPIGVLCVRPQIAKKLRPTYWRLLAHQHSETHLWAELTANSGLQDEMEA